MSMIMYDGKSGNTQNKVERIGENSQLMIYSLVFAIQHTIYASPQKMPRCGFDMWLKLYRYTLGYHHKTRKRAGMMVLRAHKTNKFLRATLNGGGRL